MPKQSACRSSESPRWIVIGDAQDWETNKRREFQNDALIALTAVRHGAAVVTTNTRDFALLARSVKLTLITLA
ncbi:MAG: hypothetical protein RL701_7454 [Pseudomonadota bacterium]